MGVIRWLCASSLAAILAATTALATGPHDAPVVAADGLPGEMVYRQGSAVWRLQQTPCGHESLAEALIEEDTNLTDPKAAVIQHGNRRMQACWAQDFESDVVLADVSGKRGFIPRAWFRQLHL